MCFPSSLGLGIAATAAGILHWNPRSLLSLAGAFGRVERVAEGSGSALLQFDSAQGARLRWPCCRPGKQGGRECDLSLAW